MLKKWGIDMVGKSKQYERLKIHKKDGDLHLKPLVIFRLMF